MCGQAEFFGPFAWQGPQLAAAPHLLTLLPLVGIGQRLRFVVGEIILLTGRLIHIAVNLDVRSRARPTGSDQEIFFVLAILSRIIFRLSISVTTGWNS